jgi:hypothetical protein
MHAGTVCLALANHRYPAIALPDNHGSIRTVKVGKSVGFSGLEGRRRETSGEKVRRKVVSPLRFLTVTDMLSGRVQRT